MIYRRPIFDNLDQLLATFPKHLEANSVSLAVALQKNSLPGLNQERELEVPIFGLA